MKITAGSVLRFSRCVDRTSRSGCWFWTAGLSGDGYGAFTLTSRDNELIGHALGKASPARAHRIAFLISYGRLPANALHLCDMPLCVNPDHIFDGTQADNMMMVSKNYRRTFEHVPLETIDLLRHWYKRGIKIVDLAEAVRMKPRIVNAALESVTRDLPCELLWRSVDRKIFFEMS